MEKHYLCPMGKLEKVSDQYFVSNRVLFDEEQPIAFEECMLVGNDKYPYIALAIKKEYRHQGLALRTWTRITSCGLIPPER